MTAAGPAAWSPSDPAAGDREDGGPRRRRGAQLELDRKEPGAGGEGAQHHGLDGDEGGRHREPAGRHDERGQRVLEPRIGVGHVGVHPAGRLPAAHQLADPALVPEDVGVAGRVVVARDEPGGRRDDEAGGRDRDGRRDTDPRQPQRRAPDDRERHHNHEDRPEHPRAPHDRDPGERLEHDEPGGGRQAQDADPDPLGRRRRAESGRSGDPDQPAEHGDGREGCGVRSEAGRHRRPY